MPSRKIGVVLFQLGGPDSMEAVEPFLYNLFCDPDIINFPGAFLARKWLARVIATRRAPIAGKHYAEIGGKSPILELTMNQREALERQLQQSLNVRIFVAMRYWHPLTEEVIAELQRGQFSQIILLPLYPQYSLATTFSSVKEWQRQCTVMNFNSIPQTTIQSYHDHPLYID